MVNDFKILFTFNLINDEDLAALTLEQVKYIILAAEDALEEVMPEEKHIPDEKLRDHIL